MAANSTAVPRSSRPSSVHRDTARRPARRRDRRPRAPNPVHRDYADRVEFISRLAALLLDDSASWRRVRERTRPGSHPSIPRQLARATEHEDITIVEALRRMCEAAISVYDGTEDQRVADWARQVLGAWTSEVLDAAVFAPRGGLRWSGGPTQKPTRRNDNDPEGPLSAI